MSWVFTLLSCAAGREERSTGFVVLAVGILGEGRSEEVRGVFGERGVRGMMMAGLGW